MHLTFISLRRSQVTPFNESIVISWSSMSVTHLPAPAVPAPYPQKLLWAGHFPLDTLPFADKFQVESPKGPHIPLVRGAAGPSAFRIEVFAMPIYEFKCTNSACSNLEEHLVRHSDPLPSQCEKCASPIEKLVSQTSFALKGSGWYVTDYKGSTAGSSASPTNSNSASTDGKSEAPAATPTDAAAGAVPACATSGCAAN
jgi:putative FmdB family regulatory protein